MKRFVLDNLRKISKIPLIERFLASKTKGRFHKEWICRLPAYSYLYPVNSLRRVNRDCINYELDLSDDIQWWIFFGLKENSRENLYKLVQKENVVLDIGSNIGEIALNFSKMVGENGFVHSFEPDPINYKRLNTNFSLNNFKNLKINNFGLSDANEELSIFVADKGNRGANRLVKKEENSNSSNEFVTTIMLDEYLKDFNHDRIDVIKIDVEGFELKVLNGAKETLKKHHPKLFIEVNDLSLSVNKGSSNELLSFLIDLGYNKFSHAETFETISLENISNHKHFDLIAV